MFTRFVIVEWSSGLQLSAEKEGAERWRIVLRNLALLGEDSKCGILFSSSMTGMTVADVMKSWSLVDFLYRRDREAFVRFAARVLEKQTIRALEEAYALSPEELDAAWREWIADVG